MCQLGTKRIVTKIISEINFVHTARQGDVIEFGVECVAMGTSSITVKVVVRNKDTGQEIVTIDKMVFVAVDENGKSTPHGKTQCTA